MVYQLQNTSQQNDELQFAIQCLTLVVPNYSFSGQDPVSLQDLDEKSKKFPLCMKTQHDHLRKTHHLKYFSRRQYGLFLKGLGLSLAETLNLFQTEFMKTISLKRFLQKYAYLFKHLYGTVGSCIDYAPMNCEEIQEISVGPGQVNGCPYKHWDAHNLKTVLKKQQLSDEEIKIIVDLKEENRYQDACGAYFKAVNDAWPSHQVNHPNQYFVDACDDCCRVFDDDSLPDIEDLCISK